MVLGAALEGPKSAPITAEQSRQGLLAVLNGVTLVLELSPFGDEALTAFLAAALDQVAACFARHTGTEPVLVLTGTLGWLICPFHFFRLNKCFVSAEYRGFPKLRRCLQLALRPCNSG